MLDLSCDVCDREQITRALSAIRTELGEPEVLLYNAGSGKFGTIAEIKPKQFEADWRVNAFGAFVAAKEAAPDMIARGHGAMLFTGATAGVKAGPRLHKSIKLTKSFSACEISTLCAAQKRGRAVRSRQAAKEVFAARRRCAAQARRLRGFDGRRGRR